MSKQQLRYPAVPLVTHDPFFSVWSFHDQLTADTTRHWDGVRKAMMGMVTVDGVIYEFLGTVNPDNSRYIGGFRKLPQISCEVRPMTSIYHFENELIHLEVKFTSPLLLNDLKLLSRPVSYVTYHITAMDGKEHDVHVIFGFTGEFCVNEGMQTVHSAVTAYSVYFSSGSEHMLQRAGDDNRIEWGEFHVIAPDHEQTAMSLRSFQYTLTLNAEYGDKILGTNQLCAQGPRRELQGPLEYRPYEKSAVYPDYPTIRIRKKYTLGAEGIHDHIALAYNDFKSIQYFGENIDAYWKKDGDDFNTILSKSVAEYDEIMEKVRVFEDDLLAKARKISDKYADIVSLAYRQAIAGHKLTYHDGELQFSSKECYSNGCIATVDVTYPSVPLFLIYAPELVEGMLNPIFKMIDKGLWPYEFAPHDAGTYPLANGQVYGFSFFHRAMRPPLDSQMPVEECGNMILCVAGVCFAEKKFDYFKKHRKVLTDWADYLVKIGYNPDNQLCTDDFAGHLAHNCNLSAKGICALGAFAKLLDAVDDKAGAAKYRAEAEKMAAQWVEFADDGDHYRLTFDQPGTWSLKYNMVWDRLLDLKLFAPRVYDKEIACYKKVMQPYGNSMDARGNFTKSDWQMWTTMLKDDPEYTNMIVDRMWQFLNDTPDRVPFCDLYFVNNAFMRAFQARTVQGGLFINLLKF